MKNKQRGFIGIIAIVIIALAVIGGGAYVYTQKESSQIKVQVDVVPEQTATSTNEVVAKNPTDKVTKAEPTVKTETKIEVKTVTQTQVSLSDPWALIEKYKAYSKARDLAGLNSISYKSFPPCGSKEDCDSGFGFLESVLSGLNKGDFVNNWEDSKQIILATDVKKSGTTYTRHSIVFTKDVNGNLKLVIIALYLNDEEAAMTDSDKDGLTDQEEKCEGASQYRGDCKVTDPTKRDTDSDGWWDGVEAKF